jgi:hypothetical protein
VCWQTCRVQLVILHHGTPTHTHSLTHSHRSTRPRVATMYHEHVDHHVASRSLPNSGPLPSVLFYTRPHHAASCSLCHSRCHDSTTNSGPYWWTLSSTYTKRQYLEKSNHASFFCIIGNKEDNDDCVTLSPAYVPPQLLRPFWYSHFVHQWLPLVLMYNFPYDLQKIQILRTRQPTSTWRAAGCAIQYPLYASFSLT